MNKAALIMALGLLTCLGFGSQAFCEDATSGSEKKEVFQKPGIDRQGASPDISDCTDVSRLHCGNVSRGTEKKEMEVEAQRKIEPQNQSITKDNLLERNITESMSISK